MGGVIEKIVEGAWIFIFEGKGQLMLEQNKMNNNIAKKYIEKAAWLQSNEWQIED